MEDTNMKTIKLLPLLAIVSVLGLSGCSNSEKVGEAYQLEEATAKIICNKVQENGRFLASSKLSYKSVDDDRKLYPTTGTCMELAGSHESQVYKNYVVSVSSESSIKNSLASEVGITYLESSNVIEWIGDPVDKTLEEKQQLFMKTTTITDGISSETYSAGEVLDLADTDDYFERTKINSLNQITDISYNFKYDSDWTYVKVSDKVVKAFITMFEAETPITNPSYPSDATKVLQPFTSVKGIMTFENLDSIGWAATSVWESSEEYIYTDNDFNLLDEPIIKSTLSDTLEMEYSHVENLPTYSDELEYVEPDASLVKLTPMIAVSDGSVVSDYITSFVNVTNYWNTQYGTNAQAVFMTSSLISFQRDSYYGLTNSEHKVEGENDYWGLDSVKFVPESASSLLTTYTGVADSKLFGLSNSVSAALSGYMTFIYDAEGAVEIIYTNVNVL